MSRNNLILFLGSNLLRTDSSGIMSEAREFFPNVGKIIVVAAAGDKMLTEEYSPRPPRREGDPVELFGDGLRNALAEMGANLVEVGDFEPAAGESYVLIANGGTTGQQLPVFGKLLTSGANVEAYNLQRDGAARIWPH